MSSGNPRQLCVIGAAQHTVRDGNAAEPLTSWSQRAHQAAAAAGVEDVLPQTPSSGCARARAVR